VVALERDFSYRWPETTVHPADLLDSSSGPYAVAPRVSGWQRRRFLLRQRVKTLLGMKPHPLLPYRLAVQSFALVRKP
jgi:hypothetical protein